MTKYIIPFGGYPIYLSTNNRTANDEEINYLREINTYKKRLKYSNNSHIFENKKLEGIKKIITDSFDDYKNNVLQIRNSFYICNSWSTLQKKGEQHHCHFHANHIFSAVYYAKVKKTSLIFYIERSKLSENFHFSYDLIKNNVYNSDSWRMDVSQGDIIIFPGHLRHESSICEDDERIIVGSSFFIKGKLGSSNEFNDINLK